MKKLSVLVLVMAMSLGIVGCGSDSSSSNDSSNSIALIVEGPIDRDECIVELVDAYFLTGGGEVVGPVVYGSGSGDCNDYSEYKDCKINDINGGIKDRGHCVGFLVPA